MEVILIKPVRKVGKIADIRKVKNGFARHYLLPNKLAIRATEANKQLIISQKQELEEKDTKFRTKALDINDSLNNKKVIFIKQAADDGRLFGSVNNKEIAENLSKLSSYPISYLNVVLDKPIKSIGLFTVTIRLHAELSTNITAIVARSESEAQEYLKDKKPLENKIEDSAN